MAHANRTFTSNFHRASTAANAQQVAASGPSPALLARVNEKKLELENLKQLRDLSAGLANQMRALEEKLSTLAGGTEAVAVVLSNWHNVLRAIHMASMKVPKPSGTTDEEDHPEEVPLPQTLVRIPVAQPGSEGVGPSEEDPS
ncbi:MAG: hypothetical protein M1823_001314 [Watsoniomyces obsoletus]|nr:MAG: hypothetical protein M1823_001314 [Watsoniomyces obsoletus]